LIPNGDGRNVPKSMTTVVAIEAIKTPKVIAVRITLWPSPLSAGLSRRIVSVIVSSFAPVASGDLRALVYF